MLDLLFSYFFFLSFFPFFFSFRFSEKWTVKDVLINKDTLEIIHFKTNYGSQCQNHSLYFRTFLIAFKITKTIWLFSIYIMKKRRGKSKH